MKKEIKKGVSVIIPTFNRVKFLYPTLVCLCNQKIEETLEYEIIIIDSGDDETEKIVNKIKNTGKISIIYKRIRKCKNRSLLRNTGAYLAKYSILCFLDNDILVPPNFIQTHFDEHIHYDHLVLLGCRKSLTHFDFAKLGEEALQKNFNILEKLPYYTDERISLFNNVEPWRYVFSHTLSIDRLDYIKSGGFNKKFGEHWGFEDLELGFNLQLIGCNFKLLTNQFTYHQPHFTQSSKEQREMAFNAELFLRLHNCFECELYESFYKSFDELYPVLIEIKKSFKIPSNFLQKRYDLIFGCLFSSLENVPYKNMYLGIYSTQKDNTCKKVLILDTFFKFPKIIQMSIISEAFRISHFVCIRNKDIDIVNYFIKIAFDAGLVINYNIEKEDVVFIKKEDINSKVYIMLLPDIFEPEKRFVYSWLAAYLIKNGVFINLIDLKKTERLEYDDFCLPTDSVKLLEDNIERSFGKINVQFINSLSMLTVNPTSTLSNPKKTFVIQDDDYFLKYISQRSKIVRNTYYCDSSVYCCFSFFSVLEQSEKYKNEFHLKSNKGSFCCFMENGYKEDGIDLILEAFSKYVQRHSSAKLTVKLPNYQLLENAFFKLHNDTSKYTKLFASNQKHTMDYIQLTSTVDAYGLNNKVKIIQENYSVQEIVELIGSHETLVFASRGCIIPPQVYIALLLGKNTIIGTHHIIFDFLKPYCSIIESSPYEFSMEMNVPASCMNLPYLAFRINTEKLEESFNCENEKMKDEIKVTIEKETKKVIETYFLKERSFVEG